MKASILVRSVLVLSLYAAPSAVVGQDARDETIETDNQSAVASVPIKWEWSLPQRRENDYFNLDIGPYRTASGFHSLKLPECGGITTVRIDGRRPAEESYWLR